MLNKKKIHIFIIILSSIILLEGCTKQIETPIQEEIYEKYASGVVLTFCEYYHSKLMPTQHLRTILILQFL